MATQADVGDAAAFAASDWAAANITAGAYVDPVSPTGQPSTTLKGV
jgi:hypothetical protein